MSFFGLGQGFRRAALGAIGFLLLAAPSASATFHHVMVREVYPETAPGSDDSYVELQAYDPDEFQQFTLGKPLTIYNADGSTKHRHESTADWDGDFEQTLLIGDTNAAGEPDAIDSDLEVNRSGGAVCWNEGDPPDCVAWGNFTGGAMLGAPGAGTPISPAGIPAGKAIRRTITRGCATAFEDIDDTDVSSADFEVVDPDPRSEDAPITETDCGEPPETFRGMGPSNPTQTNTYATFTFSGDGATFECSLDHTRFAPCASPQTYNQSFDDGFHRFEVRGRSEDGAPDPTPAIFEWNVDTQPPSAEIDETPPLLTNTGAAHFEYSSGELVGFQCKIDSGGFSDCGSGASATKDYSALADGSHTFTVKATDGVGLTGQDTYTWTVDQTPPNTVIDTSPDANTPETDADFTFHSTEVSSTFLCKRDLEAAFTACPVIHPTYSSLAEGAHTFSVNATDPAGNTDVSPATFNWTVDHTAPDTVIDTHPTDPSSNTSANFTYHSTEGSSTFECRLTADPDFASCPVSGQGYADLLDGETYTFSVRATDETGNTDGSEATYQWTVDLLQPPDTTITKPPKKKSSDRTPSVSFTSPNPPVTFECKLDDPPLKECTSPKTFRKQAYGPHTVTVQAKNAAGPDPTPAEASFKIIRKR